MVSVWNVSITGVPIYIVTSAYWKEGKTSLHQYRSNETLRANALLDFMTYKPLLHDDPLSNEYKKEFDKYKNINDVFSNIPIETLLSFMIFFGDIVIKEKKGWGWKYVTKISGDGKNIKQYAFKENIVICGER